MKLVLPLHAAHLNTICLNTLTNAAHKTQLKTNQNADRTLWRHRSIFIVITRVTLPLKISSWKLWADSLVYSFTTALINNNHPHFRLNFTIFTQKLFELWTAKLKCCLPKAECTHLVKVFFKRLQMMWKWCWTGQVSCITCHNDLNILITRSVLSWNTLNSSQQRKQGWC